MEMKIVILISFCLGFIAGWGNDKAMQSYYDKLTLSDHLIVPSAILFVIYAFFQSINFGFMAIIQIMLGVYVSNQINSFIKTMFKKR